MEKKKKTVTKNVTQDKLKKNKTKLEEIEKKIEKLDKKTQSKQSGPKKQVEKKQEQRPQLKVQQKSDQKPKSKPGLPLRMSFGVLCCSVNLSLIYPPTFRRHYRMYPAPRMRPATW